MEVRDEANYVLNNVIIKQRGEGGEFFEVNEKNVAGGKS